MMKGATTADAYPLSNMDSVTTNSFNPYVPKPVADVATRQQGTTFFDRETSDGHRDELPTSWVLPQMDGSSSKRQSKKRWKNIFWGWRLIVFNSWLNLLLVFVPVSLVISHTMEKAHSLVFASSILSLVPLVKLHDLATGEFAIRLGGHKTGLLNASMSNIVEMVIAISALRKCELQVVQSALIGSILSRLLLVLGLCFFAGGMRFSEQGFDATATQIHSSLMSISVGALVLPAAYHFTINRDITSASEQQRQNILHMSYGVSIVLLFIYGSYLIFQLCSHTHLYHDKHNKKSRRLSIQPIVKVPKETTTFIKNARKRLVASVSTLDKPRNHIHVTNRSTSSQKKQYPQRDELASTSNTEVGSPHSEPHYNSGDDKNDWQPGSSTVRLVNNSQDSALFGGITPPDNHRRKMSDSTQCEDLTPGGSSRRRSLTTNNRESYSASSAREPQLSWTLTFCLLLIVTIIVIVTAEDLVESLDGISSTISKDWAGLVLLPGVTAVAECITAVNVSVRDELTLSISVALGSSIQTALFVLPSMVILGWITHKPLSLLLSPFQSLVLYLAVQIMSYVVADGKSNWLEGVILICLYVIIAVSFWFYPSASVLDSLAVCSV